MAEQHQQASYQSSHNPKQPTIKTAKYEIASLWRIFGARLIDVILVSFPGFILHFWFSVKPDQWSLLYINLAITFGIALIYFVILPWFCHGQTLGKLMTGLRLKAKGKSQPSFLNLLLREAYFLLIPWLLACGLQIAAILIMKGAQFNEDKSAVNWSRILVQMGYLFYLVWFIYLVASIKVQDQYQAMVDLKMNLYVVNRDPLVKRKPRRKIQSPWAPNIEPLPGVIGHDEQAWLNPEDFYLEVNVDDTDKDRLSDFLAHKSSESLTDNLNSSPSEEEKHGD